MLLIRSCASLIALLKTLFSTNFWHFFSGESRWIISYPANRVGTIFKHQIYAQHLLLCIIMEPKPVRRTILFFAWIFKLISKRLICFRPKFYIPSTTKTQINLVLNKSSTISVVGHIVSSRQYWSFLQFWKNPNFEGLFFIFSWPKWIRQNWSFCKFSLWCCKWVIIFLNRRYLKLPKDFDHIVL